MRSLTLASLAALLTLALPAQADRRQVYSIAGADCGDCGREARNALRALKGVKKSEFDIFKVELTLTLDDKVTDEQVTSVIKRKHPEFNVIPGAGHGSYLPQATWPENADMAILTKDGSAVGPLEKLRVPGKYTVFDVYADWCGPCRVVDGKLRDLSTTRKDIAVRKLNVVKFDTPLAKELGTRLTGLPYVIVFDPSGKRTELLGMNEAKLLAALGGRR